MYVDSNYVNVARTHTLIHNLWEVVDAMVILRIYEAWYAVRHDLGIYQFYASWITSICFIWLRDGIV